MSASPEELHELLKYCMEFAQLMLTETGEFHPFGARLENDGRVSAVAGDIGSEHPDSRELYAFLAKAFTEQSRKGEIRGAAVAANVNVPAQYSSPYPDALRVQVESTGYARYVYVPYLLQKQGLFKRTRTVTFGEPFAVEIGPHMFVAANA